MTKMHAGEVVTDAALVSRLLVAQFPQWANLPLERVNSSGTDNAIYRLGEDMAVRLPRIDWAVGQVEREQLWLPKLAPFLPFAIPIPLALAKPTEDYPWNWSICRWIVGENPARDSLHNPGRAALDLAQFISALQAVDSSGGPLPGDHNSWRGAPLSIRDSSVRDAILTLQKEIDTKAMTAAWEAALQARKWDRQPVWIHGDLAPGNLLVEDYRISGVIDWGCLGVGDPAVDLMIAWTLFSAEARKTFRDALQVDDGLWARARGWALSWALIFIPYYLNTNPNGVALARRTIAEVLVDSD